MKRNIIKQTGLVMLFFALILAFGQVTQAALQVGPIDPQSIPAGQTALTAGFPAYYMDGGNIALDLIPIAGNGVTPPTQIYTPPDPANPYSAFLGFESEAFYYFARNLFSTKYGKATATFGLEASFVNGIAAVGEEMVFARIRLKAPVRDVGTYTFTHPWGTETIVVTQADIDAKKAISFTRDVGLVPRAFDLAAAGPIQVFAKQLSPAPPAGWIGDGASIGTITPGPNGAIVKLTGPVGIDLDGRGNNFVQSNQFTISGRVLASTALPSALSVERATCLDVGGVEYIDVFVTSDPTATVTVSGTYVTTTPMIGDGLGKFYVDALGLGGHGAGPFPITVTAATPGAAVTTVTANVVDMINIIQADYSLSSRTLAVKAKSSDGASILTLAKFTPSSVDNTGVTATIVSFPLGVPPANVTVTSSMGGSDTQPVTIVP